MAQWKCRTILVFATQRGRITSEIGAFRTCRESLKMSAHRGAKQTSRRNAATSVFDPGCVKTPTSDFHAENLSRFTMNWKRTALPVITERRKARKQFCAFSARARFHTAWTRFGHGYSRTSAHNCAIEHSVSPSLGVHLEQRARRAAIGGYSGGGCRGLLPLNRDRRRRHAGATESSQKDAFRSQNRSASRTYRQEHRGRRSR